MRGMDGFETLTAWASRRGEPLGVAVRHHLLEGLLRRLARLPCAGELVLRGGLMTRAWVAPRVRPTRDLDLVGDFPFDLAETTRRFRGVLDEQVEDGLELDPARFGAQGIWLDTDFPGVRVTLGARLWGSAPEELTVDIGFGDPLVPEAGWLDYPALQPLPAARVRACCPETMAAWKLHGLAERGASWRPKDLADLWLIVRHVALRPEALPPAIEAAFVSRAFTLQQAADTLQLPHWSTKSARVRWASHRGGLPELGVVLDELRTALAPALKR
jgi:hypothetical protein